MSRSVNITSQGQQRILSVTIDGQTRVLNVSTGVGPPGPPGSIESAVIVSDTPPINPEDGSGWLDSTTGIVSYWDEAQQVWVAIPPTGETSVPVELHAETHATGGGDPLAPSDIGAQPAGDYATNTALGGKLDATPLAVQAQLAAEPAEALAAVFLNARGPFEDSVEAADNGVELGGIYKLTAGSVGWRQPLSISSLAVMGDSISTGVGGATNETRALGGYIWPVFAMTGGNLELVRDSENRNFQTGGFSAQQIIDTWLPQVIAAAPDACVILAGANSLDDARVHSADLDVAAAWLYDQIEQLIDGLRNAGIRPIVCTLTPDKFPTDTNYPPAANTYHPDYRTIRAKTNDLIRANAVASGAVLCDWSGVISTDPTDDTALADVAYMSDDVHPNYLGWWALGHFLAGVIQSDFAVPADFEFPASDDASWATGNPYMTGDVSGLATGWSVVGTPTVTRSKTTDGWQRLSCADGPNPGTNTVWTLERFIQVTDDSFDGRLFDFLIDLRPQSADWEIWHAEARLTCNNVDSGVIRRSHIPTQTASVEIAKISNVAPIPERLVLRLPPILHPGGTSTDRRRITVQLLIYGRGTFDVVVMGARDVTP